MKKFSYKEGKWYERDDTTINCMLRLSNLNSIWNQSLLFTGLVFLSLWLNQLLLVLLFVVLTIFNTFVYEKKQAEFEIFLKRNKVKRL